MSSVKLSSWRSSSALEVATENVGPGMALFHLRSSLPKHHGDASGGEMAMWLETHENSDLALPFAGCIVE
jgi:hypothetical protein